MAEPRGIPFRRLAHWVAPVIARMYSSFLNLPTSQYHMESPLLFWGKAQPSAGGDDHSAQTHPLVYHSLDVAAVGAVLASKHPGIRTSLARFFPASPEQVRPCVVFLLAIHDIGKFAKKFQAKAPEAFPSSVFARTDPATIATTFDHGSAGFDLLCAHWDALSVPGDIEGWLPLLSAVTGHHGSPPSPMLPFNLFTLKKAFGAQGIASALAFVQDLTSLFDIEGMAAPTIEQGEGHIRSDSHILAGLAVLADWIGSNQDWFRYRKADLSLEDYWGVALARAEQAVDAAGVLPASIANSTTYTDLIAQGVKPTPMQCWAEACRLPDGPSLFLIEDETGSGKTEAAIMLAHRIMAKGAADGVYVALPTMATANAMFDRLAAAYRHLFSREAEPSVALSHSARDMHPAFGRAILPAGRDERPYESEEEQDTTASSSCAAWIADDRRRAFLADVGAGTIDQALLAVLPARHQSLRLLGLMRKVLILDEIHAYDAYMAREIEALLEFQAALGGSAILLSATLPLEARRRLKAAFRKGLGDGAAVSGSGDEDYAYPLASTCSMDRQKSYPIRGAPGRARRVPVRFLRDPGNAIDKAIEAASRGQAVLYIRNTVDDALHAYEAIADHYKRSKTMLFHSRFVLADRLEIEAKVLRRFGKESGPKKRKGRVLVATQVVEQSLDLDFDLVISDLAPIDLLIQRAGRLWRHAHRGANRKGDLEMFVVSPEPTTDADADWYGSMFPRADYVYKNTAALWRTAHILADRGGIDSPGELRDLIEFAYAEDPGVLPEPLHECLWESEGQRMGERGLAAREALKVELGYVRDGGAWDRDDRTQTRLNDDPQYRLRLGIHTGSGSVVPYAEGPDTATAWRLSELSVSARKVSGESIPEDLVPAADLAKASWRKYDADKILVVLQGDTSGLFTGKAQSGRAGGGQIGIFYDRKTGLKTLAPPV